VEREFYIGSISGTSLDGIDVALVCFEDGKLSVVDAICSPIPASLQRELTLLCSPGANEIYRCGQADVQLGKSIALAVNELIGRSSLSNHNISAIGSHGQTIRHHPELTEAFSLQIGNASVIAELTGITTVSDFRMADIACGGQGAPLVPAFHQYAFSDINQTRLVINLGGISNISVISPSQQGKVHGYDIGPANTLMDRWIERHLSQPYDKDGEWARSGALVPKLLENLLNDPYFSRQGPKSTGREYFNLDWLFPRMEEAYLPQDIQRTLLELTAKTVGNAILSEKINGTEEIYLCGGGAHNSFLTERISTLSGHTDIRTTQELGVPVDDVEATAFAWLAREALNRRPGNITSVTGARKPKVLGAIHFA